LWWIYVDIAHRHLTVCIYPVWRLQSGYVEEA
jgi:hypothetical protein